VLDILQASGARATSSALGERCWPIPALIAEIVARGHAWKITASITGTLLPTGSGGMRREVGVLRRRSALNTVSTVLVDPAGLRNPFCSRRWQSLNCSW